MGVRVHMCICTYVYYNSICLYNNAQIQAYMYIRIHKFIHTHYIYMYVCILTLVIYTYKQVYAMCGRPTWKP